MHGSGGFDFLTFYHDIDANKILIIFAYASPFDKVYQNDFWPDVGLEPVLTIYYTPICDPTVVICYLIWPCDIAVHITYLISHSSSLSYNTVIKGYFSLGV